MTDGRALTQNERDDILTAVKIVAPGALPVGFYGTHPGFEVLAKRWGVQTPTLVAAFEGKAPDPVAMQLIIAQMIPLRLALQAGDPPP
jgi:hypothetical protein